jgi:penicillin V acylase-like amidase (Ntn superfamily)
MCTRIVYTNENKKTITGRNMDWADWSNASIWVYPAGVERNGAIQDFSDEDQYSWTSLYKSVTTAAQDGATADGMNDQGLVANLLWLSTSEYPSAGTPVQRSPISISVWAQYILDMCKDVNEAIEAMNHVYLLTANYPGRNISADCHLSVSDKKGNSAIFEYIEGVLNVSTNVKSNLNKDCILNDSFTQAQVRVMTNQPVFKKQIQLNSFWENVNEKKHLPGGSESVDRFVRASFYTKNLIEGKIKENEALAGVMGIMRNAAQPFVNNNVEEKNLNTSITQYTTISDQENGVFYFAASRSPFVVWLDLNEINFPSNAAENKIGYQLKFEENGTSILGQTKASGNAIDYLVETKTFSFIKATTESSLV